MIIKNKLTGETLELTYPEFREKFAKEIVSEKSIQKRKILSKLRIFQITIFGFDSPISR